MRSLLMLLLTVLLMTSAERAGPRSSLWTAFTRVSLGAATLTDLRFEPGQNLRLTLTENPSGQLETVPIAGKFDTAVVSWNAVTPTGSSLLVEVRARFGTRWSRYYRVATWSTDPALPRSSFAGENDSDGRVNTDTLELKRFSDALQIRVTLRRGALKSSGAPVLTGLAAILSDSAQHNRPAAQTSNRTAWGTELPVPALSQMIYPNGGEVWCSPTSVTMILAYWDATRGTHSAEPVPSAAQHTWDTQYDGSGNWAFNAAYAGARGYRAFVGRLSSLSEAEAFVERGVPLVLSIAWGAGELDGVHLARSNGHLVVLRGFTASGDPIINDPAASTNARVRTVYRRAQFEQAWIAHSGGVVYVIEPATP